jgi:hypothetical protein
MTNLPVIHILKFSYNSDVDKKPLKYTDIESQILTALERKGQSLGLTPEPLNIIGMTSIQLQDDLSSIQFGGNSLPVVVVVGQNTGRVYQFALKALLPDLEF